MPWVIQHPAWDLVTIKGSDHETLDGKICHWFWGIIVLMCVSSGICLHCCCGIFLQYSQIATKWATSKLVTPLVDHSGPTVEEEDGVLEDVIERTWPPVDPLAGPQQSETHPLHCPWNVSFICLPCSQSLFQEYSFEIEMWFRGSACLTAAQDKPHK